MASSQELLAMTAKLDRLFLGVDEVGILSLLGPTSFLVESDFFPVMGGRVSLFGQNSLPVRLAVNAVSQRDRFSAAFGCFAARPDRLAFEFLKTDEL
jgi:hypothetical protein